MTDDDEGEGCLWSDRELLRRSEQGINDCRDRCAVESTRHGQIRERSCVGDALRHDQAREGERGGEIASETVTGFQRLDWLATGWPGGMQPLTSCTRAARRIRERNSGGEWRSFPIGPTAALPSSSRSPCAPAASPRYSPLLRRPPCRNRSLARERGNSFRRRPPDSRAKGLAAERPSSAIVSFEARRDGADLPAGDERENEILSSQRESHTSFSRLFTASTGDGY